MKGAGYGSAPVSLLEIIEVIAEAAALKLVERFGGGTVRIPARCNVTPDHPLAQCIGVELLTALVAELGGARWLYIPLCAKGIREQRNREIVRLYSAGEKVENIVRRFKPLSDRQVWNILKKTVVDDRQGGLF